MKTRSNMVLNPGIIPTDRSGAGFVMFTSHDDLRDDWFTNATIT